MTRRKGQIQPPDPNSEKWKGLRSLQAFNFSRPNKKTGETQHFRFAVGDDVLVNSSRRENDKNIWLGRIAQIREGNNNNMLPWVKVYWYCSGTDVAKYINSFSPQYCAPKERMLSNWNDIIAGNCLTGVTYVHEYFENSLDPPDIGEDKFFTRHRFLRAHQSIYPSIEGAACKLCKQGYNPFPAIFPGNSGLTAEPKSGLDLCNAEQEDSHLDLSVVSSVMHFCPRPQCRQWYHHQCLHINEDVESESESLLFTGTRSIRFLAVDPDDNEPHPCFEKFIYPKPVMGKTASTDLEMPVTGQEVLDKASNLPSALIQIA